MPGKTSITNEAFFEYMDSKENIKKALKEIKELEEICFNSNHPQVREMTADVRRIKEILESGRKASDIDKNN